MTYSVDGKSWSTHLERFQFAKAPGTDGYLGEEYRFAPAIRAKMVRFHALSTHRAGGQRDLAGLGKVRFLKASPDDESATAPRGSHPDLPVPADLGYVDATAAPYFAKGNGTTDDTLALQRAVTDCQGSGKVLWLPPGTYLVSGAIAYKPGVAFGYNNLRGSGRDKTVVRLKDGTFTDRNKPLAVLSWAFNGREDGSGVHADWFNCNVSDLTIDTGKNNPGAIGLRYYSNNVGAARRIAIRSGDGQGPIGLDLGYADQNGPCLVSDIGVVGFETGVSTGATVNSQTLEHVRLRGQTGLAWENKGQCLAIRDLHVTEAAGDSSTGSALWRWSTRRWLGRQTPRGLRRLRRGKPCSPAISNRKASPALSRTRLREELPPLPDERHGVRVGKADCPLRWRDHFAPTPCRRGAAVATDIPGEKPYEKWANVLHHRKIEDPDDSAAFQRACDAGAEVVYWPTGVTLILGQPVNLPATLRRIVGGFSHVNSSLEKGPAWRIVADAEEPLFIDEVRGHVLVEKVARRTLVVRDCQGVEGRVTGPGDVFLENVVAEWEFGPGRAWCRQFNTEREGTHCVNGGETCGCSA